MTNPELLVKYSANCEHLAAVASREWANADRKNHGTRIAIVSEGCATKNLWQNLGLVRAAGTLPCDVLIACSYG